MRRAVIVVALCSCSSPQPTLSFDASSDGADAMPDALPCGTILTAPDAPPPAGCVKDGLAGLDLDGAWTFTGVRGGNAYTTTLSMVRTGTGTCMFDAVFAGTPVAGHTDSYADDTAASEATIGGSKIVCIRPSDGMLSYRETDMLVIGGSQVWDSYDGVLTR